jgi:hypothetical protein
VGQGIQTGHAGPRQSAGLSYGGRGGHPDPQAGEQARADVDRHSVEVGHRDTRPAAQLVHRGHEHLGMAPPGHQLEHGQRAVVRPQRAPDASSGRFDGQDGHGRD